MPGSYLSFHDRLTGDLKSMGYTHFGKDVSIPKLIRFSEESSPKEIFMFFDFKNYEAWSTNNPHATGLDKYEKKKTVTGDLEENVIKLMKEGMKEIRLIQAEDNNYNIFYSKEHVFPQ